MPQKSKMVNRIETTREAHSRVANLIGVISKSHFGTLKF